MTNQARRVQAEQALTVYLASKGQRYNSVTIVEDVTDLVADIFHLIHAKGYDPDTLAPQALAHFTAEVDDHDDD